MTSVIVFASEINWHTVRVEDSEKNNTAYFYGKAGTQDKPMAKNNCWIELLYYVLNATLFFNLLKRVLKIKFFWISVILKLSIACIFWINVFSLLYHPNVFNTVHFRWYCKINGIYFFKIWVSERKLFQTYSPQQQSPYCCQPVIVCSKANCGYFGYSALVCSTPALGVPITVGVINFDIKILNIYWKTFV